MGPSIYLAVGSESLLVCITLSALEYSVGGKVGETVFRGEQSKGGGGPSFFTIFDIIISNFFQCIYYVVL